MSLSVPPRRCACYFSLYHTPPPYIYTLSLHDALPIFSLPLSLSLSLSLSHYRLLNKMHVTNRDELSQIRIPIISRRSEEHTSELQSHSDLVCRLLLEKKKSPPTTAVRDWSVRPCSALR